MPQSYPEQYRRYEDYTPMERDEALTVAQFMLSPSVPPSQRRYFEEFYLMFDHIMALGNI